MNTALIVIQVISAITLVVLILLQNKSGGLGGAFGGGGAEVYHTKKGAEKFVSVATIVCSIIFFGVALANLFV
jgi:preprotein translocase subunit SecG